MESNGKEISLEAFHKGQRVFSSRGKWLHPLFELEDFLKDRGLPAGELAVRDKIVGKAAALLMVRLGLRSVEAGLMSLLGEEVFLRHGVRFRTRERVERILCRTESILLEVNDPEEAYRIIAQRIAAARGRS
jgi:hypothetical protein